METRFKRLEVWKDAMILVKKVYTVTSSFPESERFGLSSQLQRAIVSVASNIAGGSGRGTQKDFINFLNHARGSLYEVMTQLEIAASLMFIPRERVEVLVDDCEGLDRRINALISSMKEVIRSNEQRATSHVHEGDSIE
ncbi:MAG: four helix bundle protein [Candidatus Thorarchaeota archaeon]|nr:four helix bundle protein [Candidatus Thorarchaeota archaeon]